MKINYYTNKLAGFPILKRQEINKIVKEIYKEGIIKGRKGLDKHYKLKKK